ncbi:MAG: 4Fe-4S binding protein [Candidatus Tenebribacter mawsonii]|nr:4Fe-4S binding protein [Candidatus Tenebribacter mawsonii]
MKNNKAQELRRIIQYGFLGITMIIIVLLINGKLCSAHGFCPYSSVCFGIMSLNPGFAKLLYPISVIIGLLIAVTSILWGRRFCGYACPFGTVQEIIYNLNPRSKKNRQLHLPVRLHKLLNGLKYIIMLITILAVFLSVQYIYMKFCPVLAVSHPQNITIYSIATLFVIFIVGYFINRFWCRYLCPYAALMNVFQYIGKLLHVKSNRIHANEDLCVDCRLCSKCCPMQIVIHEEKQIENVNCIFCLKCLQSCPIDNGIVLDTIKLKNKKTLD